MDENNSVAADHADQNTVPFTIILHPFLSIRVTLFI